MVNPLQPLRPNFGLDLGSSRPKHSVGTKCESTSELSAIAPSVDDGSNTSATFQSSDGTIVDESDFSAGFIYPSLQDDTPRASNQQIQNDSFKRKPSTTSTVGSSTAESSAEESSLAKVSTSTPNGMAKALEKLTIFPSSYMSSSSSRSSSDYDGSDEGTLTSIDENTMESTAISAFTDFDSLHPEVNPQKLKITVKNYVSSRIQKNGKQSTNEGSNSAEKKEGDAESPVSTEHPASLHADTLPVLSEVTEKVVERNARCVAPMLRMRNEKAQEAVTIKKSWENRGEESVLTIDDAVRSQTLRNWKRKKEMAEKLREEERDDLDADDEQLIRTGIASNFNIGKMFFASCGELLDTVPTIEEYAEEEGSIEDSLYSFSNGSYSLESSIYQSEARPKHNLQLKGKNSKPASTPLTFSSDSDLESVSQSEFSSHFQSEFSSHFQSDFSSHFQSEFSSHFQSTFSSYVEESGECRNDISCQQIKRNSAAIELRDCAPEALGEDQSLFTLDSLD